MSKPTETPSIAEAERMLAKMRAEAQERGRKRSEERQKAARQQAEGESP